MNKNFRNSRKALAPAIAVALLLAITIALVAAVGYAVTNVTPSASAAPQGTFDVEITKHGGGMFTGYVSIKQISGDAIDTGDIKLKFTVNGQTSEVVPNVNNTFYLASGYPFTVTDEFPLPTGTTTPVPVSGETFTSDVGEPVMLANRPIVDGSVVVYNTTAPTEIYEMAGNYTIDYAEGAITVLEAGEMADDTEYLIDYTFSQTTGATYSSIWYSINHAAASTTVRAYDNATKEWVTATATENILPYTDWLGVSTFREYTLPASAESYTEIEVTSSNGLVRTFERVYYLVDLRAGQALCVQYYEYNSPWQYEAFMIPTKTSATRFGEYSLTPGYTMKAIGTQTNPWVAKTDDLYTLIPSWDSVRTGDVVEVLIVYTASNQVIWQGNVIVG